MLSDMLVLMCKFYSVYYLGLVAEVLIYLLQVLIDESTQSTEPECLIPLVLGVKQVVANSFCHIL